MMSILTKDQFNKDRDYLAQADAQADEGPVGEDAARSILQIAKRQSDSLATWFALPETEQDKANRDEFLLGNSYMVKDDSIPGGWRRLDPSRIRAEHIRAAQTLGKSPVQTAREAVSGSDAGDDAVLFRTIARMARDPSKELRGDIALLAEERAAAIGNQRSML